VARGSSHAPSTRLKSAHEGREWGEERRKRHVHFAHSARACRSHRKPPRSALAAPSPCAVATRAKVRRQAEGIEMGESRLARARKIE